MPSPSRMSYTIEQKRSLILKKDDNPHMSLLSLAEWAKEEFKLSKCPAKSSIQTILKARGTLEPLHSVENANARRKKTLRCLSVEKKLVEWIMYAESKGFFVNQRIIRIQASKFCREEGVQMGLSNGWLFKFQKRHHLRLRARPGEAFSVSSEAIKADRAWLRQVTSEYSLMNPRYITALSQKNQSQHAPSNADGAEKLDLVFIGKSKEPRCFKRVGGVTASGLQYWHAKKGWMTSIIFQDWLSRIEQKFKAEGRHVIMLVDNVSSHRLSTIELEYVRVVFLPPKTTAVLQPMDAGVIEAFKQSYKSSQMETSLTRFDNGLDVSKCFKFDILEAMEMSTRVWSLIDATSIANSWGHTGILVQESDRDGNLLLNMLAEVHL
ncbi:hypothetical protein Ae201684P_021549 [Aphanomyces euteiches]|nr:hypothetical protein Ae201684P_021549 [Aphanomyces euteiches]